jgi:thymidylate kinase
MKIITLSGLDGSGKSTQTELLEKYLKSQRKKVYYFHAIDFSIGNKIIFWKHKKNKKDDNGITKAKPLGILLRKIALIIDIWRFKKLVKKLEKQNYDYILSDRFFYDVIVNIEYLSKQIQNSKSEIKKSRLAFINRFYNSSLIIYNCFSVYLQTDPSIIMTRAKNPPKQGLQYLEDKKEIYDNYAQQQNWTIINNTNLSKEETALKIQKLFALFLKLSYNKIS